jgi:hypothetical protein
MGAENFGQGVQCFSTVVTPEAVPFTRVYVDAEIGLTGISRPARIIVEWAPPPCFSPTLVDMKWWCLQNFGGFSYYINSICIHRFASVLLGASDGVRPGYCWPVCGGAIPVDQLLLTCG